MLRAGTPTGGSRGTAAETSNGEFKLIEAARGGDEAAFAALVARYEAYAFACAYAVTNSPSLSEEIVQEAFLAAWRALPSMRPPYHFRAWLFGISRNTSLYLRRTEWARSPLHQRSLGMDEQVHSADPSPLERVITQEETRALLEAMANVPEAYRIPLVLHYGEQQSISDVAEILGLTESNVRQRLHRGRRMLQEKIALVEGTLPRMKLARRLAPAIIAAIAAGPARVPEAAARGVGSRRSWRWAPGTAAAALTAIMAAGVAGHWQVGGGDSGRLGRRGLFAPATPAPVRPAAVLPAAFLADGTSGPGSPASEPLRSRTTRIFAFDFEDGVLPRMFDMGDVAQGPAGSPTRFCVVGTVSPTWPVTYTVSIGFQDRPLLRYSEAGILSFDYWIGDDTYETEEFVRSRVALAPHAYQPNGDFSAAARPISVKLRDDERKLNHVFYIRRYTPETWTHVEVPLSAFGPVNGRPRLEAGDPVPWMTITGGRAGGKPFFVDNVTLTVPEPL